MLWLSEISVDVLMDPEKAGAKELLSHWMTLPIVAAIVVALAILFAWSVARMFPKPRSVAFGKADFGLSELDLALLVPLAVVFMAVAGLLTGGIKAMLEPEALQNAYRAATEQNLAPEDLAKALAAARAKLSAEDLAASTFADHAGKIAGALGLILYVPLMLYIVRDKRTNTQKAIQGPHVAIAALHFQPAQKTLWRVALPFVAWTPLAISLMWLSVAVLAVVKPETLSVSHEFNTQPVLARLMAPSMLQWPAAILSAVIAAPLFEEFVFRGVIQGALRRVMPFPFACLIPVVLFTAVHEIWDSPQILIPVAGLGIALGWVYERTGNVWHAVALHALHNGATLALAYASGTK